LSDFRVGFDGQLLADQRSPRTSASLEPDGQQRVQIV